MDAAHTPFVEENYTKAQLASQGNTRRWQSARPTMMSHNVTTTVPYKLNGVLLRFATALYVGLKLK